MARTATKTKVKTKSRDVSPPDTPRRKKTSTKNRTLATTAIIKPNRADIMRYGGDDITAAINSFMATEIDALEKKYEMVGGSTKTLDKVSSDSLVLDLILGGGFTPTGICQMAGFEQAGKTTTILHTFGRALTDQKIGYIGVNDAENTFDIPYLEGIFGDLFDQSLMDRLRYSDQNILETYFDFIRSVLRGYPDKIWVEDAQSFHYRINTDNKTQLALRDKLEKGGIKSDKLLSDRKHLYYPTEDTNPQALFGLDSFPSLITGGSDDRESDESGGMSERARKLAEILPRFTGYLRRKGVLILGTNQLREKPGVTHGDPVYEPMGNALKFYSAQRTRVTSRSMDGYSGTFKKDKDAPQLNVEDNPLGGRDYYSFKEFKNTKNKAGTPFLRGWCRIWTADPNGQGHGIDPVFDLWEYLSLTGQIKGGRTHKRGFYITMKGAGKTLGHEDPINWHDFKLLVLAEKYGGKYLKAVKELGYAKPPKLLALAWKQRGKEATQLRTDHSKAVASGQTAKDADEE